MDNKKEKTGLVDSIQLVCRRKDGSLKWIGKPLESNSVTKTGAALMSGLLLTDVGGTACDVVAIGDSNAAESEDHNDLQAAVNKKRKAGTGTQVTTQVGWTNDTAQIVATFSSADGLTGTWSVQEGGMFNNTVGGTMLFRKIFTAKSVNWDAGDTLELTAKCQIKQGT